ncbi:MAG: hypothetical protein HOO06_10495 [Bdellovibrionaceae bacterium]|jgi:hypothetical protein|nr:hypothetical protein [Pseudobdellovibrionaceae bacterium]
MKHNIYYLCILSVGYSLCFGAEIAIKINMRILKVMLGITFFIASFLTLNASELSSHENMQSICTKANEKVCLELKSNDAQTTCLKNQIEQLSRQCQSLVLENIDPMAELENALAQLRK